MVSLFNVPLFVSDWSFGGTFYIQLFDSIVNPIFSFAKALEGESTL